QRNAKPRGSALHRSNAWYDIDSDTRRLAGRDLLGRAPENQRVAALETNDALALLRQAHHQSVDVFLRAGRAEAGLPDQHLSCFTAREVHHLARHEVVEQDHVGGLQTRW